MYSSLYAKMPLARSSKSGSLRSRHFRRMSITMISKFGIGSADITNAGLQHLKGLTNLEELIYFSDTKVTDAGVKGLQKSLPKLKILPVSRPVEKP